MGIITSEEELKVINNVLDTKFSANKSLEEKFYDLCFVICIPQTKYKTGMKVLKMLKEHDFFHNNFRIEELKSFCRSLRFYNNKAKALSYLHSYPKTILDYVLGQYKCSNHSESICRRNTMAQEILGLGMKTASHFMRNTGTRDVAIIDTHILHFLGIEHYPSSPKEYLYIEKIFYEIANKNNLSIAELDLYIWKHGANVEYTDILF